MTQTSSVFIVNVRGSLGPRNDHLKSVSMLNHLIRWVDGTTEKRENIECEADPRHREVLLVPLCLSSTRGPTPPLEKVDVDDSTMVLLEHDAVETFRGAVMRLSFLALDRHVVQYATKEAACGMAKPWVRHRHILRRCARCFIRAPTLTRRWYRQRCQAGRCERRQSRRGAAAWLWQDLSFGGRVIVDSKRDQKLVKSTKRPKSLARSTHQTTAFSCHALVRGFRACD